jgi:pimeloyl-ACP methyl ester carboxylesterase
MANRGTEAMRKKLATHQRARDAALETMAFVAREISATVRVGLSVAGGWRTRAHRPHRRHDGEDAVVLVHGLMATAAAFTPMVRHFLDAGVTVHTFTFLPGSSLDGLARRIDRAIADDRTARRIHLVGHSLGGLACRWYVQEHAHDARIAQTISIASPFHGVDFADAFPDAVRGVVMPLNQQLQRVIDEAPRHLVRIPHLSVVAERDPLVRPMQKGVLPGAPSWIAHGSGHNGVLYDEKLHALLVRSIKRWDAPDEPRVAVAE